MSIHPSAIVSPTAHIASDVKIGPFCTIEDGVEIGSGCILASQVVVKQGTRLGRDNIVDVGAVLGAAPQHLGVGERIGNLVIGDCNQIREHVTVHRAFHPDQSTTIGNNNMLMVASHVAHDCRIGDHNVLANNVMLAGHVEVAERNYFGGGAAVHQFCRIGSLTMIGGLARITKDVPPFVMVDGDTAGLVGLNRIGLRRAGMPTEQRQVLKEAYRCVFRSHGSFEDKLRTLKRNFSGASVRQLIEFLEGGTRGFLQDRSRRSVDRESVAPYRERNKPVTDTSPRTDEPRILPFRRAA